VRARGHLLKLDIARERNPIPVRGEETDRPRQPFGAPERPTIGDVDQARAKIQRRDARLDEAEIRGFLSRDYPRLVNAVALASGSYPAAEDAVQEALVRAWIRSQRGEQVESLPAWVAAVALNLTRSGWRRTMAERRARRRFSERSVSAATPGAEHVDVARALEALPRRQREVAVLRYLLELSTAEVARTLGITEGTVKSSLARARAHLVEALAVHDTEVTNDVEGR
jgi:RNA polymerase sigma-70 factor (ECF subfamily)